MPELWGEINISEGPGIRKHPHGVGFLHCSLALAPWEIHGVGGLGSGAQICLCTEAEEHRHSHSTGLLEGPVSAQLAKGLQIETAAPSSQNLGSSPGNRPQLSIPTTQGSRGPECFNSLPALGRKPGLSPRVFSSPCL